MTEPTRYTRIKTKEGNEEFVLSLDGYEGCEVLEKDCTYPRLPCCERVDGKWKIQDKEKVQEHILESESLPRMRQRFKALEERLAKAGL